jgi:centromeric protein E
LAEKEFIEDEYRKRCEEAKKREEALENDLANMWVLVAKLKKDGSAIPGMNADERHGDGIDHARDPKMNGVEVDQNNAVKERQDLDASQQVDGTPKEEPLVVRLKVNLNYLNPFFFRFLLCFVVPICCNHSSFLLAGADARDEGKRAQIPGKWRCQFSRVQSMF